MTASLVKVITRCAFGIFIFNLVSADRPVVRGDDNDVSAPTVASALLQKAINHAPSQKRSEAETRKYFTEEHEDTDITNRDGEAPTGRSDGSREGSPSRNGAALSHLNKTSARFSGHIGDKHGKDVGGADNFTAASPKAKAALSQQDRKASVRFSSVPQKIGLAGLSLQDHRRDDPLIDDSVDEPEHAPVWYMTMSLGFGAASFVLAIMIFLLYLTQLAVMQQQRLQARLAAEAKRQKSAAPEKEKSSQKAEAAAQSQSAPAPLSRKEVADYINKDGDRLNLLLAIAEARNPQSIVDDLVKRGSAANKIKLSPECVAQVGQGLISLAQAAHGIHRVPPRTKLVRSLKEVHRMVRVSRAFRLTNHHPHTLLEKASEKAHAWAENHPDQEGKYNEGSKGSVYKDVNIKAKSVLGAYFASEKWIDHAGIALLFVYSQLCGIVYATYLRYRFPKMFEFMGPWVLVSRGEAMSIIVTTIVMVLLLTRRFMTWMRPHVQWSTVLQNIVDKHAMMHQWCGILLVLFAALHILGHLRGSIPAIVNETDNAKINDVFTYGTKIKFNFNSWSGALRCYPAVTGYCLVLILAAFWALSNSYVRRRCFELFHYPHLILIVLWTWGLWAHGARQWLGCGVPLGLLGVAPVVAFYFISRVTDIMRAMDPKFSIKSATIKAKSVLLEIDTAGNFNYDTGMYCMLKVPEISSYQWHPFTIASAGGAPVVRVLFAIAGDWTTKFAELLKTAQMEKKPYPEICIRGGYGAPAEGMKDSEHIVMVGAGVGATPFLSFLASICTAAEQGSKSHVDHFKTAVFYWVSREPEDFAWVNHYNAVIAATPSLRDRVSVRLCLSKSLETAVTKECSAAEVALFWIGAQVALSRGEAPTLKQQLGVPTQFGRPDWMKELGSHGEDILQKFPRESGDDPVQVGVYVCGNPMLVESIEQACDELDTDEVEFTLYAEQF